MINLTDREKQILNTLKQNPMIQQKDLAKQLNITRSAVAVHIANLSQKGHIKGKGYIFKEKRHVTFIGGTNIDITGIANDKATLGDSNIGTVSLCAGGVGRNIAENFARISRDEMTTYLVSCVGSDIYGDKVLSDTADAGVDVSLCEKLPDRNTATYLSIIDGTGEMMSAINHMDIITDINKDFVSSRHKTIVTSNAICIDTNLTKDTLDYICKSYHDIPIFVDTVSGQNLYVFNHLYHLCIH